MRIGIDIDNTLNKVQDKLNKAAFDYAISLGKKIDNYDNPLEDIKNNGDTYKKKFQFSYEELKHFLKEIQEDITNNALPRENVKEVIDKLKITLGDANGDGVVNSVDALLVLKQSAGLIKQDGAYSLAMDSNKDGVVNSADFLLILKYSADLLKITI